jgi:fumarate reductase flavoprotein subunit
MRLSLSSLGGSSGGIMVDSNLQVLDNEYHTIPGLYAAGLNAGGFYGPVSTYYDYEGSAMMFATNSGRIAGKEAGIAAISGN